jgi:hypothetical protein
VNYSLGPTVQPSEEGEEMTGEENAMDDEDNPEEDEEKSEDESNEETDEEEIFECTVLDGNSYEPEPCGEEAKQGQ